ncbi:MAG: hypothetical protein JNK24_00380 [Alphaproteobacteria bacterium]|nr:hypothetical protein [Alphaproteobacteria bacterium]
MPSHDFKGAAIKQKSPEESPGAARWLVRDQWYIWDEDERRGSGFFVKICQANRVHQEYDALTFEEALRLEPGDLIEPMPEGDCLGQSSLYFSLYLEALMHAEAVLSDIREAIRACSPNPELFASVQPKIR